MKFATLMIVAMATVTFTNAASADQPAGSNDILCQHMEDIRCASFDLKDEIKDHLRGTRGYVKMLATNAALRTKAAAIKRRVNRNSCYRRLEADVARLNELACELQERFDDILECSTWRRPVRGDIGCIQAKINEIRGLAACSQVETCQRLGLAIPAEYQLIAEPLLTAPTMAPGAPVIQPIDINSYGQPVIPQQNLRSVLESDDPIILPSENPGQINR